MGTATRLVDEGTTHYNKGDAAEFTALYSDDVVLTTPDGTFQGREATRQYVQAQMNGFPDVAVTLGRRCEDGDLYFGEYTVTGTNTGPIALPDGSEMPPTGRSVEFYGTEVVQVSDGKVIQHDMLWDRQVVLEQLGLFPGP